MSPIPLFLPVSFSNVRVKLCFYSLTKSLERFIYVPSFVKRLVSILKKYKQKSVNNVGELRFVFSSYCLMLCYFQLEILKREKFSKNEVEKWFLISAHF